MLKYSYAQLFFFYEDEVSNNQSFSNLSNFESLIFRFLFYNI
jgi:hypothetical protein